MRGGWRRRSRGRQEAETKDGCEVWWCWLALMERGREVVLGFVMFHFKIELK